MLPLKDMAIACQTLLSSAGKNDVVKIALYFSPVKMFYYLQKLLRLVCR
jgi:hypothetical protein